MLMLVLPALLLAAAPIEIVYNSDMEGHMASPSCSGKRDDTPDLASLSAAIDKVEAASKEHGDPAPFIVLGGDTLAPDPFIYGPLSREGRATVQSVAGLLKQVGYEAVSVGHRELYEESEALSLYAEALAKVGIPLVLSNLSHCDGSAFCQHMKTEVILQHGALRVGVVAVVDPPEKRPGSPQLGKGMVLFDPVLAVRMAVRRLRAQKVDAVLLLAQPEADGAFEHLYHLQQTLAKADGAPDLILASGLADPSGRTTVRLWRQDYAPPLIGSTFATGSASHIVLNPPDGGPARVSTLIAKPDEADPAVKAALAPFHQLYCNEFGAPVGSGKLATPMSADDFASYALNVLRKQTGAEIALLDRRLIRSVAFPLSGTLIKGDLARALPGRHIVGIAHIQGAALGGILARLGEERVAALGIAPPGPDGPEVNGRPLDPGRGYTVATVMSAAGHILPPGTKAVPNGVDLVNEIETFMATRAAEADHDPSISLATDFGPPPDRRLQLTLQSDLNVFASNSSIKNPDAAYPDPQVARPEQRALRIDMRLLLQLRHPRHEMDSSIKYLYGYARQKIPNMPAVSGRTQDVADLAIFYEYRGLREVAGWGQGPWVPDPYTRLLLETTLAPPDPALVPNAPAYQELRLIHTAGVAVAPTEKLRLRLGAGYTDELLADDSSDDPTEVQQAATRLLIEAGAVLSPMTVTMGGLPVMTMEGELQYMAISPVENYERQFRGTARIAVPIAPLLFITFGVDAYAVTRGPHGWARSLDTTIGLKVHLDRTHQGM